MDKISDQALLARADSLTAEAAEVVRAVDFSGHFNVFGDPVVIGSAVSGLMVTRDLDVMFTAPYVTTAEVFVALAGISGDGRLLAADFRDERGDRRPGPAITDERFYVVGEYLHGGRLWKIDITIWLHIVDRPHRHAAEALRNASPEQRLAILRIKDRWRHSVNYPYAVSGTDVYTAVLDHGVRTDEEFSSYLRERNLPTE
ncbi:hypothetical protein [Fodinicola acaciae]|uniref:hypothetical protein n=1 Tax=Fodinicola acaciae TaxID=2681555 RepID=UPI0013D20FB4|nr:hypothetical protein [Fodinicola acaciae]